MSVTPRHTSAVGFAVLATEPLSRQLLNACAVTAIQCVRLMQALDTETVKDYLAERQELAFHVGPSDTKSDWQVGPLKHPPPCLSAYCPFRNSPCSHARQWSPSLQIAYVLTQTWGMIDDVDYVEISWKGPICR